MHPTRCRAKTRRGTSCRTPAMKNGRFRMHGGKSTGPPRGTRNAWKHGRRSAAAVAERKARTATRRELRRLISLARCLLADSSTL